MTSGAQLNKQVWINQIKNNFYPDRSFLTKAVDLTAFVENQTIHFPSSGIDPEVLINNTTYPIRIVGREDDDNILPLDKFETENTLVRNAETIEYSYDQLESVIYQHRNTLQSRTAEKAAHAFAPNEDSEKTPVLKTTGESYNGRKRLTFMDVLSLKERFDAALIPIEKRYLILHPSHVTDLMAEDLKLFKDLTEVKDGEPKKLAGFGIFQFPYMPRYNISTLEKVAFGENTSKNFASVAFQGDEVMKADGEIKMYARYDDPEERGTIVGFEKRFIAMPIRNYGIGAIISDNA